MKRIMSAAIGLVLAVAIPPATLAGAAADAATARAVVPYGANPAASGTFVHDGVTLYYETYGKGEPLLLVHGNGGSIGWLAAQIAFFRTHRRVIVMDGRDQGRSGDSAGPLTYEAMTDDLAALLDHLKTGPVDVVGWSDGGIEALLLGLRHPGKVGKLVAMAPNLTPAGLDRETTELVTGMIAAITPEMRNTPAGRREAKVTGIMLTEPHIDVAALKAVTAPTLILSGDTDLIRLDHIVAIYEALPNAALAVFPNSTHFAPYDDPALFNATVERFLTTPFRKTTRIADTVASYERLAHGLAK